MTKHFHFIFISVIIFSLSTVVAQQTNVNRSLPIVEVTGEETGSINNKNIVESIPGPLVIPDVSIEDLLFSFHATDYFTGYDLQSNSVPQQIWQDPNNPAYVHGIMMHSGQTSSWSDRTCTYFLSTDFGNTWVATANIPATGEKSGFPAIEGMQDGRQVIADHDNAGSTTTHTKIYLADAPGSSSYTAFDPGTVTDGDPIWPRICVVSNDNILSASSINMSPEDNAFTINLNPITGVFSNYSPFDGDQAECYSLAVSEDGSKTGHLYIANGLNPGDLFFRESSDGGYTWGASDKIWDWSAVDSLGCLRGLDLVFLNNQPCAVFEVDKLSDGSYYPSFPSKIYFWSPVVNGGVAFPVAESGINVPYYNHYQATNDIFTPVCRPTIGRSSSGQSLFVAFSSVTENVFGDTLSGLANSYFAGYFTYSTNAGQDWTQPVKFTPDSPLRDWRYVSVSPTNNVMGENCIVQMFIQSDSIPGSNVNAPPGYPVGVTAQMIGVTAEIQGIIPVELVDFEAQYVDGKGELTWQTATEKNNLGFKVLRSGDSKQWKEIGFVEGNGTSTQPHSYHYSDENVPGGTIYYRLKQIDYNGTYTLLKIASLKSMPDEFRLFQNYPNPFNPSTKIKYTVSGKGNVSIKVFDVLGNEVSELVNAEKGAGEYETVFNAGDLSSGLYFYQMKAGKYISTKKMLLLK